MSDEHRPSNIPIPDPSLLTTEQLRRELASLRELLLAEIARVKEVNDEKFRAINAHFGAIHEARVNAMSGMKEVAETQNRANASAADKQAAAFTKQIDSINEKIETKGSATEDRINDLGRRLDRGEGTATGVAVTQTERRSDTGLMVQIIMGFVAGAALLVAVLSFVVHH